MNNRYHKSLCALCQSALLTLNNPTAMENDGLFNAIPLGVDSTTGRSVDLRNATRGSFRLQQAIWKTPGIMFTMPPSRQSQLNAVLDRTHESMQYTKLLGDGRLSLCLLSVLRNKYPGANDPSLDVSDSVTLF